MTRGVEMGRKPKHFLTKSYIDKILRFYSIRAREFDYSRFDSYEKISVKSSIIKRYHITIQREVKNKEYTEKILVVHSRSSGLIEYVDRWEIKDGQIEFICRDKGMKLESEVEYIQELQNEIKSLKEELLVCKNQMESIIGQEYGLIKKTRGRGQPRKYTSEQENEIVQLYKNGINVGVISKRYMCTRKTIYKVLDRNSQLERRQPKNRSISKKRDT